MAFMLLATQGLQPEYVTQLLAASGGPKWLAIAGLDQYLFCAFFKKKRL